MPDGPVSTGIFAVCVDAGEYAASLERWKIYRVIPDAAAERQRQLRILDESGDDYLYPSHYFRRIDLPAAVEALYERSSRA